MKKTVIAYVPVLHNGYINFFEKHANQANLYILGDELISEFTHLRKEIRQLNPNIVKLAVTSWHIFEHVYVLDKKVLQTIKEKKLPLILPREDIMEELQKKYFSDNDVMYDNIFLRWDKHNTVAENVILPDITISTDTFDKEMIHTANTIAENSSDWWRRIGCVIVKNGEIVISSYNKHLPSEHSPYVNGDPRNNFKKGVHLELGTSIHSEAGAIAEAARSGTSLEGASAYVSTFPCPPCAKLIAYSGIKKVYYRVGYGVLDAESILKENGVEIIRVAE